ncbi:MAG: helicase C-terminal domain-containing protein, partial [Candidatus Eisenbacteria bacterium]
RYRSAGELLGRELQSVQVLLEHCTHFASTLRRASSAVATTEAGEAGEALMSELELVSSRWEHLGGDLSELSQATDPDWVYWQSRSPGSKTAELRGAPVWVGDHARRMVLSKARASILTSATLSSAGDFDWAAERLGLGEQWGLPYETASYPSPFPLHQQMRVFVYEAGPDEAAGIGELIVELTHASERNLLVLFTAHQRLKRVREHISGRLPAGRRLLAQEWDGPAGLLAERFRNERGAVLLGVQSLWEGVDFPGETLELLVVAKLPFSVPDDPLVEARGERLRDRGLDPFGDDAVPEAVVRFRQGVGRLIRRSDDRGVLVVCDPRLATASYRGPFRAALPVEPQWCRDPRELAVEAARFLSGDGVAVGEDG